MDPLTLALIAGGATAVQNLPSMLPSETERMNKKELEALKRRQELGALGLTEQERSQLEQQYAMKTDAAQRAAEAQRQRLLQGGTGMSGGDVLLQEAALSQASTENQLAAQQAIEAASLQKKLQEEQQIRDLQASVDEQKQARREAMLSPFVAGASAYTGQMATEQLLAGGFSPKEVKGIENLQQEWGLSQAEAQQQMTYLKQNNKKLYDFYTNPETASYLSMMGGF